MGAGVADGTFHLTGDGFLIDGRVDVRDMSWLGYRLARARGPASVGWKGGELTIKAEATTEGGGGQGLLAVLGRSPSAQFEGARLKDGRFLDPLGQGPGPEPEDRRPGRARHARRPVLQGRRQGGLPGAGSGRDGRPGHRQVVGQPGRWQALDADRRTRAAATSPPVWPSWTACWARPRVYRPAARGPTSGCRWPTPSSTARPPR